MSLLYGSISDQLGRKLFIILPAIGSAFNAAVVLQLVYLRETLPVAFLLIGSLIVGFFGNFSIINFAVYSYASDISVCNKRTRQLGILESMTYIGGTISLLLGGVWIKTSQSYSPPFWCIIACNIVIIVYVIVALPESWNFTQANIDEVFFQVDYFRRVKALCKSIRKNICDYFALLLTNWRVAVLMTIFFIVEINFLGITDIVILYTIGEPLCWASDMIGYFLALKLFFNGISLLIILPILLAIGLSDTVILSLGLISGSSALVIMGLSTHTWMMFLGEEAKDSSLVSRPLLQKMWELPGKDV
jgi:MFS family permease